MIKVKQKKLDWLKKSILEKGYSISDISKLLDISVDAVNRRLRGASDFYLNELIVLSNILDIDIDVLFERLYSDLYSGWKNNRSKEWDKKLLTSKENK